MEHQFTVEIQIWPLDHKLGQIWPLDHIINVGIASGPLDQSGGNLSRQIALERGAKNRQKIGDLSPKYRRFIGDFPRPQAILCQNRRFIEIRRYIADLSPIYWRFLAKFPPSIFLLHMPCRCRPIQDISAIFRRYFAIFSSMATIA